MKFLIKILITSLAVLFTAKILPGIAIDNYTTAILVAIVIALLNTFLKPLLVLLTIPVTIVTLGLFLFVINAFIIMITSELIKGFNVDGFWWALLFSIILAMVTSLLEAIAGSHKQQQSK
jgi:putative membrane protein